MKATTDEQRNSLQQGMARNGIDAKIWKAGKVTANDTDREPYSRTLETTARRDRSWMRRDYVMLVFHLNGE